MTSESTLPAAWRLQRAHHVGITVSDIEQSIAFYHDVLGLDLVGRRSRVDADYVARQTGYPGVQLSVASLRTHQGGPSIELAQYLNHAGGSTATATNQAGNSHLCLVVTDLRACYAALSAKGVRFNSEPVTVTSGPNEGGLVVYLADPDGYTIELFQPPNAADPNS